MKIQDYCKTKKYDCSDCEINKNHESGNCEKLFDAYTLGYNKAIDDFAEKLHHEEFGNEYGVHIVLTPQQVDELAEQLKEKNKL